MVNDIRRAYLHAPCRGSVYVARCPEDGADQSEGKRTCWKLLKAMYGCRPSAQDWQAKVKDTLTALGFTIGISPPNIYFHKGRSIWTFVHGDDFCSSGEAWDLAWLDQELRKTLLVKTEVLGPGPDHLKSIRILNRLVSWDESRGIRYEADPRHVERMILDSGVSDMKPLATPGAREYLRKGNGGDDDSDENDEVKLQDILEKRRKGTLGKDKNPEVGTELPPCDGESLQSYRRLGELPVPRPTGHLLRGQGTCAVHGRPLRRSVAPATDAVQILTRATSTVH